MMDQATAADELRAADRRLQAAMLASDIAELDRLLDDRLIYTGGPDGGVYGKRDDLELHRSGQLVMSKVTEEDLVVLVDGRIGVTWFLGTLEGMFGPTPAAGRMRFTRTWVRDDAYGWRVIAAHASPAAV
jgi:hypothetical protein